MKILNLTMHNATKEQVEAGVFEPTDKEMVRKLLNFDKIPTKAEIRARANNLREIAEQEADVVMIGGALFLMSSLEEELKAHNIKPVYAFSRRVSEDVTNPDGSVTKKTIFKFDGFVEV